MKHLILLFTIIGFTFTGYSQCVPDTTITGANIYYPPAGSKIHNIGGKQIIVLPHAQANQQYDAVLQFKVPTDTTAFGLQATVHHIKILSIQNLPGTISLTCTPNDCLFPGGSFGCAQLSGTAAVPDSIQLEVSLEFSITSGGNQFTSIDTLRDIYLVTDSATASSSIEKRDLTAGIYPNPTSDRAELKYYNPGSDIMRFTIRNITGRTIFHQKFESDGGEQKRILHLGQLPEGIYMFTLEASGNSHTGKLIISR